MEERRDEGLSVPALDRQPELSQDMVEFITAFDLLSSRRTGGFGANPISLTDIFAYYKMYEVPINLQTFVKIICKMDSEFLEFYRKKKA